MKTSRLILPGMVATAASLMSLSASAGSIVPDLNDGSAVFSSTVALTNTIAASTLANGVTLAARFTPNATDVANSANGPVAVLEIGGSSNGSGLWIINGNLWFIGKGAGNATGVPDSNLDLDGTGGAFGAQLNAITAGVSLDVFASLDTVNGTLLISQNSVVTKFSLSNVTGTWNWQGNRTVGFGVADPTVIGVNFGYDGALADLPAGTSPFSDNSAVSFSGTVGLGQIFNGVSTVPEPGVTALVGMGGLGLAGLFGLRRRMGC
ncbi:MAG TPA: PEP-CTERM sorting domain-containing protein [Dongiaceae bacterium]|jgi:hypothetical protein|nr:PEP-CTERM sorting domain-containing protein [Dongiaceae bacterium]